MLDFSDRQGLLDNAQANAEIKKPSSGHLPDRFHKICFGIAFPHNLDPLGLMTSAVYLSAF